jgi:hypothetical protein
MMRGCIGAAAHGNHDPGPIPLQIDLAPSARDGDRGLSFRHDRGGVGVVDNANSPLVDLNTQGMEFILAQLRGITAHGAHCRVAVVGKGLVHVPANVERVERGADAAPIPASRQLPKLKDPAPQVLLFRGELEDGDLDAHTYLIDLAR